MKRSRRPACRKNGTITSLRVHLPKKPGLPGQKPKGRRNLPTEKPGLPGQRLTTAPGRILRQMMPPQAREIPAGTAQVQVPLKQLPRQEPLRRTLPESLLQGTSLKQPRQRKLPESLRPQTNPVQDRGRIGQDRHGPEAAENRARERLRTHLSRFALKRKSLSQKRQLRKPPLMRRN